MDDRRTMGDYLDMDYGYDEYYHPPPQQNPYHNDWWKTQYSNQNQYHESSYFQADQRRSNESSVDETLYQMMDEHRLMLDQMMEMLKEGFKQEEINSIAISRLTDEVEQMVEQLKQQPLEDLPDFTQADEVTFLCTDNSFDINMHEPTPPNFEVVVEDHVSSDEEDVELEMINQEKTEFLSETSQTVLHEPETPKVGEGFVNDNNTNPYPTILKNPEKELFVDLIGMDLEKSCKYKQPTIIVSHHFLTTIYVHISCWEGVIDVIFGNQKSRLLLFGPTNDPPISGNLFVINTIDDYVYEHTAYMLSDIACDLEKFLLCNRLKALDSRGSQQVKKRMRDKKHDTIVSLKSKMKVSHNPKLRVKKSTRRKYQWMFEKRFKRSRGRTKGQLMGFHKFKEGMPYDPGKTQEYESFEDKGNLTSCFPPITQSLVTDDVVGFQKCQITYDPP